MTQNITSTAPPVRNGSGPWWVVAAHALLKVTDGPSKPNPDSSHTPIFEPVAILLTNQPRDPGTKLVYTPAKSESAYILAALALRQAVTQTGIWIGHVSNCLPYHRTVRHLPEQDNCLLYRTVPYCMVPSHSTSCSVSSRRSYSALLELGATLTLHSDAVSRPSFAGRTSPNHSQLLLC